LKEIEVLYCYYQRDPAACRKISQSIKNHPDRSRIVETEYVYEVSKSLREAHTNFWEGGMSGCPLWELDPEDVVNRWEREYCHGIEEHFRDCLHYPADSFDYVVAQVASAPKKAPKKKKAKKKQRLYRAPPLRPARNTECSSVLFCQRAYPEDPSKDYLLFYIRGKPYCRECLRSSYDMKVMFCTEHERAFEEFQWKLSEIATSDEVEETDSDDPLTPCALAEDEFSVHLYGFDSGLDYSGADLRFIDVCRT
jgi:hypothetical protein